MITKKRYIFQVSPLRSLSLSKMHTQLIEYWRCSLKQSINKQYTYVTETFRHENQKRCFEEVKQLLDALKS